MKHLIAVIIFFYILSYQNFIFAQQYNSNKTEHEVSDMLETAITSVVTVAVYKKEFAKKQLGSRGGNSSVTESTYKAALDMAGVMGSGSGFIISKNGRKYVITNAHVVELASDKPGSIYIFTYDRVKHEVKLLGGDSFYDVAVLEFINEPANIYNVLNFNLDEPRIGERVYAIGNPLGEYPYTVTEGIVSALNRSRGGITGKFGFLQTTATLTWGNSGGPLIDLNGKVIGINSQIEFATAPDGSNILQSQINFALESKLSNRLVNDIINNNGIVKRAFLGIEVGESYTYRASPQGSVLVKTDEHPILLNGTDPSWNYEIILSHKNSRIIKVNNYPIRNIEELLGEFEKVKPGQDVSLTLLNNSGEAEIKLSSRELQSKELGIIAKHVISNDGYFKIAPNSPFVILSATNNKSYSNFNNELGKYSDTLMPADNFRVVAGGIYNKNNKNIWRVEDFSDLGAVLKMCGLYGIFDLIVSPEYSGLERDIQTYRINLSGNKQFLQKTLWY